MAALALEPVALEPRWATAVGEYKGAPATLTTRLYRGARVRFFRVATLEAERLKIGNLVGFPLATTALPILGIDLVDLGGPVPPPLVVADLFPVEASVPSAAPAGLRRTASWLSPGALLARLTSAEDRDRAFDSLSDYPFSFVRMLSSPALSPFDAGPAQEAYVRAHQNEDRGLELIGKLFGAAWAGQYLDSVFFPSKGSDE